MSKRGRGQRGCASFSKKLKESDYYINFGYKNQPVGPTRIRFLSWFGLHVKQRLPLHLDTCELPETWFDQIWLETQDKWNFTTNAPYGVMREKAISIRTNFKSRIFTKYVKTGKRGCDSHEYLDPVQWEKFLERRNTKEAKEKSKRAKENAAKNTCPPRVGRSGWVGFEDKVDTVWSSLKKTNKSLEGLGHERTKRYIAGRAKKNEVTNSYELPQDAMGRANKMVDEDERMRNDGSYLETNEDPIVRVLGPKRGRRTRGVSSHIGPTHAHGGPSKTGRQKVRNDSDVDANHDRVLLPRVDTSPSIRDNDSDVDANHDKVLLPRVDTSPSIRDSSVGPGRPFIDYPPIQKPTKCELLSPYHARKEVAMAKGMAYPTAPNMILKGKPIEEGCVKVQVLSVVEKHSELSVPNETRTEVIESIGDMLHSYIQWPRRYVKLLNENAPSKSSAPGMASSNGSLSHTCASLQSHTDDIAPSSEYRPQLVEVDPFLQIQRQGYVMQPQHVQSSYMSLLMNVNNLQTAAPNSFELHAPDVKLNANLVPEPEPRLECELPFVDPDVDVALDRIKERPQPIRKLVDRLRTHVGDKYFIKVTSPYGMYRQQVDENILYSDLLNMFLKGWLDVTILHWHAMHFFESPNSRCAFFNPKLINGPQCVTNCNDVGIHIKEIRELHSKKTFYLAPYIAGKHWSLIIVCPDFKFGYIVDSVRHGKSENDIPIIEEVFKINFKWHMAQCKQQEDCWECGYMVIKHMQEFVDYIQHDIVNRLWNEEGCTPHSQIDSLVLDLMTGFIKKVFNVMV